MELKILTKMYRVWMRIDGNKCCCIIEAMAANEAKYKAKALYPDAKVGYAILISK